MLEQLKNKIPALLLLGFLIAFASAGWTNVTVNSKEDQSHVTFGWPIAYLQQNQEQYDPPYPWEMHAGIPQENPSRILWLSLIIDTVFYSFFLGVIVALFYYAIPNHRGWLNIVRFRNAVAIPIIIIVGFILWAWIAHLMSQSQRGNIHYIPDISVPIPQPID